MLDPAKPGRLALRLALFVPLHQGGVRLQREPAIDIRVEQEASLAPNSGANFEDSSTDERFGHRANIAVPSDGFREKIQFRPDIWRVLRHWPTSRSAVDKRCDVRSAIRCLYSRKDAGLLELRPDRTTS